MIRLLAALVIVSAVLAAQPHAQNAQKPAAAGAVTAPVNLNTATAAELDKLPGIGQKVAARIVEYREKKGPFKKIEELMNVQGIGEKSFLRLRSRIAVASAPDIAAKQP